MSEQATQLTHEDCLDHGRGQCEGQVEYRLAPDRDDFKAFPRCERHWAKRLQLAERNLELLSDVPPRWFDPSYAGEQWDED